MKIKSMRLKNFKRFSDLTIDCIPESAKLVLLVGANGSGKSSIFDAFHWLSKESASQSADSLAYYQKDKSAKVEGSLERYKDGFIRKTDRTLEQDNL